MEQHVWERLPGCRHPPAEGTAGPRSQELSHQQCLGQGTLHLPWRAAHLLRWGEELPGGLFPHATQAEKHTHNFKHFFLDLGYVWENKMAVKSHSHSGFWRQQSPTNLVVILNGGPVPWLHHQASSAALRAVSRHLIFKRLFAQENTWFEQVPLAS